MNLNKMIIYIVVLGYVIVNGSMQLDFFAGKNIWEKYYKVEVSSPAEQNIIERMTEVEAGRNAYYAKTVFLLTLIILLVFNVPFRLGFGISFVFYASIMAVFFGMNRATIVYSFASVLTLASYFISSKPEWINHAK
ncbi:hypothetical protein LEP1GSC058_1633 [Leptospira fainei serovar Hurstbridge str. BUT 6]|uniref:Uncharacterized protein n=1 Tax=Leptospira fainei serovar Hurstbridge str. BUT 6 TaxID=1193011 RepID=S3VEM9_9LEPT|nr:hypothetical protein [Leptospira fainei]EPG74945.1 hypothetical protein LEP1GSC058_1633 [Leptospira fainei serovar Hurstbridge str. BUT 6]